MNKKNLFQSIEKGFFVLTVFLLSFCPAAPADAYHILFYYNGSNVNGAVLRCAAVLQKAGNQVETINVAGRNHNPLNDNWGAPYDQVWDMRFINKDREECGSGSAAAADYFDQRWRSKAVSFLNHCGNLFLAGEHYQLADRDEGLYEFLRKIRAVGEGFDACPPSRRGNSSTNGEAFYPVHHGLGPVSFFGAYVGGIPLTYLTGTNFVNTGGDWMGEDGVDRSIVSGWKGSQLGGDVTSPECARGKLFMVWDATMWTAWDIDIKARAQRSVPVWDESAWFDWDPDAQEDRELGGKLQKAQSTTTKFFPALARWLGAGRSCPCEAPAVELVHQPVPALSPVVSGAEASAALSKPAAGNRGELIPSSPETIIFTEPPVNIYMRFRDGAGDYRVSIVDESGHYLKTVFNKKIFAEKEAWTSWDGTREDGILMTVGTYAAVLSKDGKALRKIILSWITPKKPAEGR